MNFLYTYALIGFTSVLYFLETIAVYKTFKKLLRESKELLSRSFISNGCYKNLSVT